MLGLFPTQQYLLLDLSNVLGRAMAVGQYGWHTLFLKMRQRLIDKNHTRRCVWFREGIGKEHRRKIYAAYKAKRDPNPEFVLARNRVLEALAQTDCDIVLAPNGEADDAIASFIAQEPDDANHLIVSEDRDLWQLIDQHTRVLLRGDQVIDSRQCRLKLGVAPGSIQLMKALLGDPSDAIPRGVPKVRESILLELADRAVTLDQVPSVLERMASTTNVTETEIEAILGHETTVARNYRLVGLRKNLTLTTETGQSNRIKFDAACRRLVGAV